MSYPLHVTGWRRSHTTFASGNATRPRVVWKPHLTPARAALGETTILGSRVHAGYATTNDAVATGVSVMMGSVLTLGSAATLAFATATTITRDAGSFITDSYRVGDTILVSDPTTDANRALIVLTGVAALTLTASASSFATEAVPAGAELIRVARSALIGVPINSGSVAGTYGIPLLTSTAMPWLASNPDTCEILGPDDRIVVAPTTTISSGKWLDISFSGGDY